MQESDFSTTEFIETWNGISNMTFPEAASQSLRNIIGKMSKKSGEGEGEC